MTTEIIKPGQLVWAEYAWQAEKRIYVPDGNILCLYLGAHYERSKYHSYDVLLYGDQIVHAYPDRIRRFEGL